VTSCNLMIGAPITIGVWGEVPVRAALVPSQRARVRSSLEVLRGGQA
jgi:hypothetical protein